MLKWIFLGSLIPLALPAQMMPPPPLGGVCRQGRGARDLNLSDVQQKQISAVCKESIKRVFDLRETVNKAETELQGAFDESPVDQTKSNNAIERLVAARSDLFRATSQMDLKIRAVLTDEQWQQLKLHERRGPGRPGGPDWRHSKGSTPTTSQPQSK
jgi:Spy/CpxP family protein refolding chaperone